MQSKGRVAKTAGLVVVIGAVVWACDAGEIVSDAMVGAADAMLDGSEAIRDGASNDAAAQDRVEMVACDAEYTFRREQTASNHYLEQTYWYAELRDPAIDPESVSEVLTLRCDEQRFPDPPAPTCPDGNTCTGEQPPRARCGIGSGAEIEEGLVRVNCGYRVRQGAIDGSTPEIVSGSRYANVRVTIR